jgi:nucleoside-diphosphate-sugar epimerase
MSDKVLILGANGRFGQAAAKAFTDAGWHVAAQVRPGANRPPVGQPVPVALDDSKALVSAAAGAAVIVNALNPPYHQWAAAVPKITGAVIALSKATGAAVLIPGNIYNFGTELPDLLKEDSTEVGDHSKARIRIEMEAAFRQAGVPTIILRAGDFIDTKGGDNWFEGQITAGLPKGRITYPGPLDLVHAWAFLPDMARAAVMLAEKRAALSAFEVVNFPGYALTGAELIAAVEGVMGPLKRRAFPWWALRLIAPFNALMQEVRAMRYLWNRPHRLDAARFTALFPDFRATSLEDAIRASLAGSGRLASGGRAVTKVETVRTA